MYLKTLHLWVEMWKDLARISPAAFHVWINGITTSLLPFLIIRLFVLKNPLSLIVPPFLPLATNALSTELLLLYTLHKALSPTHIFQSICKTLSSYTPYSFPKSLSNNYHPQSSVNSLPSRVWSHFSLTFFGQHVSCLYHIYSSLSQSLLISGQFFNRHLCFTYLVCFWKTDISFTFRISECIYSATMTDSGIILWEQSQNFCLVGSGK